MRIATKIDTTKINALKPPLRWAGGKRWLLPHLLPLWTPYTGSRLAEPLCGGLARAVWAWPGGAKAKLLTSRAIRGCTPGRTLAGGAGPCERTKRSHINVAVYDSAWEASDAYTLDNSAGVTAWVKNDHLGFEILYIYRGVVRKYRPDFLVRLASGDMLVLETKGQETEQDKIKQLYLEEWIQAVNAHGGFGQWRSAVARESGEIRDILI